MDAAIGSAIKIFIADRDGARGDVPKVLKAILDDTLWQKIPGRVLRPWLGDSVGQHDVRSAILPDVFFENFLRVAVTSGCHGWQVRDKAVIAQFRQQTS